MYQLAFSCLILILITSSSTTTPPSARKNILILGGNGMMGSETTMALLETNQFKTSNIGLANRGNWYWDTGHSVRPRVLHVPCDRENIKTSCKDLPSLLKNNFNGDVFAVIDFTSYDPAWTLDVLHLFRSNNISIGYYILISTDSVYEVCQKDFAFFTLEDVSENFDESLVENDPYGHRKLLSERVIEGQKEFPFVVLRLPDVFGPRDNTHRFWTYYLSLLASKRFSEFNSVIPEKQPLLSLAYSKDVAGFISQLLLCRLENSCNKTAFENQTLNFALAESVTLKAFLSVLAHEMGAQDPLIEENYTYSLYPSVKLGPISTDRLAEYLRLSGLHFRPTSLHLAIRQTVLFYQHAMSNPLFSDERNRFIERFSQNFDDDFRVEFLEWIHSLSSTSSSSSSSTSASTPYL